MGGGRHRRTRGRADRMAAMARALDQKEELLALKEALLPELRKDLANGLTAEQIYGKYQHLAAARVVQIVATEVDSAKALAGAREILDRAIGKPKERQEIEHRLGKLPETDLDALLLSRLPTTKKDEEPGE